MRHRTDRSLLTFRLTLAALAAALVLAACGGTPPRNESPTASSPSAATALPSLAGTEAPRLPVDGNGQLLRTGAVRDFFDYCLIAETDVGRDGVDAFTTRQIAAQVAGTPAQAQALDLWRRYRAYLDAEHKKMDNDSPAETIQPLRLEDGLRRREVAASQTLGDWSDVFFAEEFARERRDIDRLKVSTSPLLSGRQKADRLAAIDRTLPAGEQAQRLTRQRQATALAEIWRLQQEAATPAQMRQALAGMVDETATGRLLRMQDDDNAWRARYAAYAGQRKQIQASGQPAEVIAAQVSALRSRSFTGPGEAARALSFDEGEARR